MSENIENERRKSRYRCRPGAYCPRRDHGFTGIVGGLADTRSAKEQGAPKSFLLGSVQRNNRLILSEQMAGRITSAYAADEAARNVEIAEDCGVEDTDSIVSCRLLLHQDRENRLSWEIQESHQRLEAVLARLSAEHKAGRSSTIPKELRRDLALVLAAKASVAEDELGRLEFARMAANLTWERHTALWRLIILILVGILVRQGEAETAEALRQAVEGFRGGRERPRDVMLNRRLWSL